jgi:hypothetical protein
MEKAGMTFDHADVEEGQPVDWYAIDALTPPLSRPSR